MMHICLLFSQMPMEMERIAVGRWWASWHANKHLYQAFKINTEESCLEFMFIIYLYLFGTCVV